MGETVITTSTTSADGQDATIITVPSAAASTAGVQEVVNDAAAFGWAVVELLGRCYLLPVKVPAQLDWSGEQLVLLQQVYTPREKIRALMAYVASLSDDLGLSSCKINDAKDVENNGKAFVEVLKDLVKQFSEYQAASTEDSMFEQLRGQINRYLFFWDLQIHDALQERPTAVAKAYQVGRTLAALRWSTGLSDQPLDGPSVEKVYQEYIPILAPYVSPYAAAALANSLKLWWQAIESGQVKIGSDGVVPLELRNQADIWFSLLTNERTAFSYVPPAVIKKNSHYTGKVLRLYWPYFAAGVGALAVIVALAVIAFFYFHDATNKVIAAAAGFIAASGIIHTLSSNLGGLLQKATADVQATKGSVLGSIREGTEQQEAVEATYRAPAGVGTPVAKNT